jgi:integrase
MKGSTYRRCWCRDPETGKYYGKRCPKLKSPKHGSWYARYEEEGIDGKRRQPVLGPFDTKTRAQEELDAVKGDIVPGGSAMDPDLTVGKYLDDYMIGKRKLKATTRETDEEAIRLYWRPGLGHLKLVAVRDTHVELVVSAMELINRPVPEDAKPAVVEMLRRMVAARADDDRRVLPDGEVRHKKSTRPVTPARIERMFAPFRASMNVAAKKGKIRRNPCIGVELPAKDKWKPIAWTSPREARFRTELARRVKVAEAAAKRDRRVLTTVERQQLWGSADLKPCPVMAWLPEHTGQFLDYLADTGERLAALFMLTAFVGLRQDEVIGLAWTEVDLDQGQACVRETGGGEGPKSEQGIRAVPLPDPVVKALGAWQLQQAAEQEAAGADWIDTGLVFTHLDGRPLSGQWIRTRFLLLAFRAGLPPIRFHDLRHGMASLLKAARVDTRVISEILGHTRTDFTDRTYVLLFPEVAMEAAEAAAAVVPRKPSPARQA